MKLFNGLLAFVCLMPFAVSAQEDMSLTADKAQFLKEFDTRGMWQELNQTSDSLYYFLEQAYRANPTLFAARAQLSAVQENLAQAKSGYLPKASADADISYNNTKAEGSNFFAEDSSNLSKSLSASVTQPLYKGGQTTAGIDEANNIIAAQQFALSEVEQSILLQAVRAYMNLYQAQALLSLRENNERLVAKELDQAQARFDVGELTITDVSQSEARLAQASANMIAAQADLKAARAQFQNIVGVANNDIAYPVIRFEVPDTLDRAIELGLSNNREILQARFNKQAATARVNGAKGGLLPEVNAVSRLSKSYDPSDFIDEQRQASISLSASIPLYTGGATQSRIRQAQKTVLQRDAQIVALENEIEAEITSHWENWKSAKAINVARQAQIDAARVAQEGVQYETEFGERTTLDALNANQELLTAQTDLITSKTNEIIAFFTLAESMGLLVPSNLGFKTLEIQ